jgi:hypothetical protein
MAASDSTDMGRTDGSTHLSGAMALSEVRTLLPASLDAVGENAASVDVVRERSPKRSRWRPTCARCPRWRYGPQVTGLIPDPEPQAGAHVQFVIVELLDRLVCWSVIGPCSVTSSVCICAHRASSAGRGCRRGWTRCRRAIQARRPCNRDWQLGTASSGGHVGRDRTAASAQRAGGAARSRQRRAGLIGPCRRTIQRAPRGDWCRPGGRRSPRWSQPPVPRGLTKRLCGRATNILWCPCRVGVGVCLRTAGASCRPLK